MTSLRFFIYLEDQTLPTSSDLLGPVTVEFWERNIDGTDERLPARVEGAEDFADVLEVHGTIQLFVNEDPKVNLSKGNGIGVLANSWKPWSEVWVEYELLPPPPRYKKNKRYSWL